MEEGEGDESVSTFAATSSPPPFRKSTQRRIVPRSPDNMRRHSTPLEAFGLFDVDQRHAIPEGSEVIEPSIGIDTDDGTSEAGEATRTETVGRVVPVARAAGEVSLVVGGRRFVCQASLFSQHPNTMLGRMFGSSLESHLSRPNDNGDYIITHAVTAAAFHAILNFYKSGQIRCPPNVSVAELHEACGFFMIPFTHTSVKCENLAHLLQQLSNQGARSQFEEFIEESILPAMARCAQVPFTSPRIRKDTIL
jgi:hypothetical protein